MLLRIGPTLPSRRGGWTRKADTVYLGLVTPGIIIKDIVVGTGAVAERGKVVVAHVKAYLHDGEECGNTYTQGRPAVIDLCKRDHVVGLRRGVEGMLVGGKRELVVSPHLAFGTNGVAGSIPANAIIRFQVELLEVRDRSSEVPASERRALVFRPGEAVRGTARWQIALQLGEPLVVLHITRPVLGATWRHAQQKSYELTFEPAEVQEVFRSIKTALSEHPEACLKASKMWSDASEKANSIPRDLATNATCLTMEIWEGGRSVVRYGLPETSPVLMNCSFYQIIFRAIAPHLADVPKP